MAIPCPLCGIPGIEIDPGIWKCWTCTVQLKPVVLDDDYPLHDCPSCECATDKALDDADTIALDQLRVALPGWQHPQASPTTSVVAVAVIYTAEHNLTDRALAEAGVWQRRPVRASARLMEGREGTA